MGKYQSHWAKAPKPKPEPKPVKEFSSPDGLTLDQINALSVIQYQSRANTLQAHKRGK